MASRATAPTSLRHDAIFLTFICDDATFSSQTGADAAAVDAKGNTPVGLMGKDERAAAEARAAAAAGESEEDEFDDGEYEYEEEDEEDE
jgi:hypothetical protein